MVEYGYWDNKFYIPLGNNEYREATAEETYHINTETIAVKIRMVKPAGQQQATRQRMEAQDATRTQEQVRYRGTHRGTARPDKQQAYNKHKRDNNNNNNKGNKRQ